MITVPADKLLRLGQDIYQAHGLSEDKAKFLTETLIEASLTGHDSHGVFYFVTYSERLKDGHIVPNADPIIAQETPSTALIDGQYALGQITAMKLTEIAVEKAKGQMVSAVGAFRCNHIGRLGFYTDWAARQGVIALMFANVGTPSVSVYDGIGKTFGTNPYSVAIPTENTLPFVTDFATSVVAAGKLTVARAKKDKIPFHWSRDKHGNPTDNPFDYQNGGWLTPFGDYKGYALQLVSELLGAVLTGSRVGIDPDRIPPSTNGVFMIAVNPEAFVGLDVLKKGVDEIIHYVKDIEPEPGKRIMIPGEPEWELKEKRLVNGIPIPTETWEEIKNLAYDLGLDIEDYMSS
jgi:LDH2 family malate/lactate/ureidoglycolate dehydrogenase